MSIGRTKTLGAVTAAHLLVVVVVCTWGVWQALRHTDLEIMRVRFVPGAERQQPVSEVAEESEARQEPVDEVVPPESAQNSVPPKPREAVPPVGPVETTVPDAAPKWVPRSVDEIRQSSSLRNVVRNAPPQPVQRKIDPDLIAQRLERTVRNLSARVTLPSSSQAPAAEQQAAERYLGVVSRALYNAWEQPTRSEVGGARPVVSVRLTIRKDGTVVSRQIVNRSKSTVMDDSVQRALNDLPKLPPPAGFGIEADSLTVTVRFELD